jgi:outer membrane immunogenic protein
MKKLGLAVSVLAISAVSASAADMAPAPVYTKAPAVVVPPVYNWTGFYVGLNAGGAWGSDPVTFNPLFIDAPVGLPAFAAANGSPTLHPSGFTGGGQAGYNWQASNWVVGIEADFNYARLSSSLNSGQLNFPETAPFSFQTSATSNWMATVRPRVGYAFDRALIYVTGGLAVADINFAQSITFAEGVETAGDASSTRAGWTVGGGFEYAFAQRWSAKLEYLHSDFGNIGFVPSFQNDPIISSKSNAAFRTDVVRAGINYSFGGAPIVAKY